MILPYPEGLTKHRYSVDADNPFGLEKDGRQFVWRDRNGGPAGAGQVPYLPPGFAPGSHMILVEGETDTMALWQNAPEDARPGIVGLSGVGSWGKAVREKGGIDALFGAAKTVWVVFDRDDPYTSTDAAKSVDRAWKEIRADLGPKAKRVQLPQGVNDVAEFFQQYDWAAFRVLLQKSLQPVTHYPRLDLSVPPPPIDWLVEDFIPAGEVNVWAADSGTGKSWIAMQLALAVAGEEEETFLGLPLHKHGRVVYVDEENPVDLIYQRLNALGLGPHHMKNLDYLARAGVDLVREPHKLLEEVIDRDPVLVVIDSLSKVALGVDENSNTEMTKVFHEGIIPLSRLTKASVVAIHHTSKDGSSRTPRGAGAIKAAADESVNMVAAETKEGVKTGTINIFPSKPRRELEHLKVRITGSMKDGEPVRVISDREEVPY